MVATIRHYMYVLIHAAAIGLSFSTICQEYKKIHLLFTFCTIHFYCFIKKYGQCDITKIVFNTQKIFNSEQLVYAHMCTCV